MSAVESVVDWRGNEIRVGSTVVYPRMSGRSCEIQEGTVEAIFRHAQDRTIYAGRDAEGSWIREKVPAYRFRIMPTRSTRFGRWGAKKAVTIQIGENVTAI